jgi:hypothetical protein
MLHIFHIKEEKEAILFLPILAAKIMVFTTHAS